MTFLEHFKAMYKCTVSSKFRDFQYRVLNKAFITNINFYKWKVLENDKCMFCHHGSESLIHLLIRCKVSELLQKKLLSRIETFTGIHIQFTEADKVLGILNFQYQNLFNLLFMIVKQYLYACRCLNTIPLLNILTEKINEIRTVENNIAIQNNHVAEFNEKWDILLNF